MRYNELKPQFLIVMGGAGVGKNHFIETHPTYSRFNLIDVDAIKSKLGVTAAIRQIKPMLTAAFANKENVAHPTTGSNVKALQNKIDAAHVAGYTVTLILIDTPPTQAMSQVRQRVRAGGHDVEIENIIKSNQKARENFQQVKGSADKAVVIGSKSSGVEPMIEAADSEQENILLDLDGVLADFDREIFETFGCTFDELGHDSQERWNIISNHLPRLYRNLKSMPDAEQLVQGVLAICAKYGYTPGVLTAIPKLGRIPSSTKDKMAWVTERWPVLMKNFNIGPYAIDKQNFSGPGQILIDDSDLNIPQWNAKGGFGILHTSAADSLRKLQAYVEQSSKLVTESASAVANIPAAPGTTPIKPGYVRLYHQTSGDNLRAIEKEGLLFSRAKGIEGPRAIWAGETPFYGKAESRPTLEFQVEKKYWEPPFVLRDVMPEDFIAAHYQWHHKARYLENNPECLKKALAGDYDDLDGDDYVKAVQYIKNKYRRN